MPRPAAPGPLGWTGRLRCNGSLTGDTPDFLQNLDSIMRSLGFDLPIPTGLLCRVYERSDAAMVCRSTPRLKLGHRRTFQLGGINAGSLLRILDEIAAARVVEVEVKKWGRKDW